MRLTDIPKEEREVLVLKLMKLLSGKIVDICLKHDGSRIIQSLYKYGTPEQRSSITKVLALLFILHPLGTASFCGNNQQNEARPLLGGVYVALQLKGGRQCVLGGD